MSGDEMTFRKMYGNCNRGKYAKTYLCYCHRNLKGQRPNLLLSRQALERRNRVGAVGWIREIILEQENGVGADIDNIVLLQYKVSGPQAQGAPGAQGAHSNGRSDSSVATIKHTQQLLDSVEMSPSQLSFNISRTLLTSLGFPINHFSSNTFNNSDEFVFVTAASDNHFYESLDAIARLQLYFPRYTIYFYDLSVKTSLSRVNKV